MEPIAVVGHIAIDRIITYDGTRQQLGGPPTYVSLITNLLGTPLKSATKVGGDFPEGYASELLKRGLDIHGSIDALATTTRFVLDYTKPQRGLGYDSLCTPITPKDVTGIPDAAILAPIVGEIPGETLSALESQILALDPQGFVRRLEPRGSIKLKPWCDKGLLRRLSVFKASARELRLVASEVGWAGLERINDLGVKIAVETLGSEGAHISYEKRKLIIPPYVGETMDTTGAGDAFIAGFMAEYASGEDVEWCAAVGSAAASAVVETVGSSIKIGRGELFERADKLCAGIEVLP